MNRLLAPSLLRALVAILLAATPPLSAAAVVVTTLAEDQVSNGNCTLREALMAAFNDIDFDLCDGDVGPDTIMLGVPGVYDLDEGELAPLQGGRTLTIRGASGPRSDYAIDLGNNQRLARVKGSSSLSLEHLEVRHGFALPGVESAGGGALRVESSTLVLRDVGIFGSGAIAGGAVQAIGSSTVDFERVDFADNRVVPVSTPAFLYGGAVHLSIFGGASIRLASVTFIGNEIVDAASGGGGNGGGLALLAGNATSVDLHHLTFRDNRIDVGGNATGGGLSATVLGSGRLSVADLEFQGNEFLTAGASDNGSAILAEVLGRPDANFRRIRAVANGTTSTAPQIVLSSQSEASVTLSELLVAGGGGRGIFVDALAKDSNLVLGGATVYGHPGNGVELLAGEGSIRLENSIVTGNGFGGGKDVFAFGSPAVVSSENLIGDDPGFVNPALFDFHLVGGSIAIDGGESTFASVGEIDFDHAPRVAGGDVDLGAYENGGIFLDGFDDGDPFDWSAAAP